jgi:putative iron-regulated protein
MNKHKFLIPFFVLLACAACKKETSDTTIDYNQLQSTVIADFTNHIAVPLYADLDQHAQDLHAAIVRLHDTTNEANLSAARLQWKSMRAVWEQSEAFLFGPVEDHDYDPKMDTWPTDYNEMDALLASANPLSIEDIDQLPTALRGYHPLEYILFGVDGQRKAVSISERQKAYMLGLSQDLMSTCHILYQDWIAAPILYSNTVLSAGKGSSVYTSQKELYIALVDAMTGICEEVGTGKLLEPFAAYDSSIVESPYSGSSMIDFRNNLLGIQNVYLGRYGVNQAKGIKDLVAAKNKLLDNKIQNQIASALAAFDNVTLPFEQAIFMQRVQLQHIMDALASLQTTLATELRPFILQQINN